MPPAEFRYQAPSKRKPKVKAAIKPDSDGPDRGEAALDASWNADTVRALRRHLGFTQQEMAEHLGTRQQTISEWERGLYAPRGA
jgi:DNA-binding transcriptional regulator YiaG